MLPSNDQPLISYNELQSSKSLKDINAKDLLNVRLMHRCKNYQCEHEQRLKEKFKFT